MAEERTHANTTSIQVSRLRTPTPSTSAYPRVEEWRNRHRDAERSNLAELHHVDAQRAERLTDRRRWLCGASRHGDPRHALDGRHVVLRASSGSSARAPCRTANGGDSASEAVRETRDFQIAARAGRQRLAGGTARPRKSHDSSRLRDLLSNGGRDDLCSQAMVSSVVPRSSATRWRLASTPFWVGDSSRPIYIKFKPTFTF